MAKNLFNRYIWLVDTIYRNGKLSFKEINDKWMQTDFSEVKPIPLRTFHITEKPYKICSTSISSVTKVLMSIT